MATHTQDLPPKGGYSPINFKRIPARSYFSGLHIFIGYGIATAIGSYAYYHTHKVIKKEEIEMRSGEFALLPLLFAERDRAFLKQVRANREEEEKLMANVEGWETGTYYGEPIYKTVPKNKLIDPIIQEFYAHGPSKALTRQAFFSSWV
ncbi:NADH dehydrogenase (ubiquinone) 1 alpha subcomplex [Halocaridina rubra]|uniref:NADH dehydrogenase [ubiquinone] 1 alpha subcomplex subunit 13 n=1 Tax=Halocaridina rubra TaxID=373956 RepID=A0AAN9FUT9_HALRR